MLKLRFLPFLVILISIIIDPTLAAMTKASPKLTQSEIQRVRENVQKSIQKCDRSMELLNKSQENGKMAGTNYSNTRIKGFQQARSILQEAEEKFRRARAEFGDAWIKMQLGLDENNIQAVREGESHYNPGIKLYNEGVELYNKATGVLQDAMRQLNNSKEKSTNKVKSDQTIPPKPNRYFSLSSISSNRGQPSNEFPISAMLVLMGTAMVSIHALRDRNVYDKLILHPWTIMRHGMRKYTVITNGLIHADPMHLGVNLMTFCFFAFLLERIVGHVDFLIIYFGSLFLSSIIVTFTKADNGYYRALGASGAIAGVIFSYILYKPTSTIHFMFAPMGVPAVIFAVFYLVYSWLMVKNKHDNIGHEAHLWGAVSGAVITMILNPKVLDVLRGYLGI